jgi:hypothetical protein
MPTKHALIVGINKYPHMGPKFQLRGCVNDAKLIRNTLINKFNFEQAQIAELLDEAATRDGILAAMASLLKRVKKDDIVVFHYSGHGHRCKSKTEFTDEGSGKDNCLLPHDDSKPKANGKADYREIRDDKINAWLQKLSQKTSNITLIFDACHSGTMTRSTSPQAQARSVPETVRGQPAPVKGAASIKSKAHKGAGGWLTLNRKYVVISGCRDTQTSKERWFSEGDTQYRHGVLTYSLVGALSSAKPGTTYRDIFETVCSSVPASAENQNPQIEGQIDREIFGVKDIEPMRYLPISSVSGKNLSIEGGAAHGLRKDSKWLIYAPGTKTNDGVKPIDIAIITTIGATSSKAKLSKANPQVEVGCRCVEKDIGSVQRPLRVSLSGIAPAHVHALESAIKKSKLLQISKSNRGVDIQAVWIKAGSKSEKHSLLKFPNSQTNLPKSDCWAFLYDDGSLAFPVRAVSERSVNSLLVSNLEKISKYRRILLLENPNSSVDVEFNLYKRSATNKLTLVNGGATEFKEGDGMVLEITNNEPDRSIYFSLVWLSADKAIDHFYPPKKNSEELAPGKTIRIGHGKRRLKAALSQSVLSDIAMETCKMIASTTQTDFSWLNQSGTRSNSQSSSSVQEFDLAVRGSKATKPQKPKDDWLMTNRSMTIHRAKPNALKSSKAPR